MAKKNIGKILTTGSTKQRLLLLAEDRARLTHNMEPLLTDQESTQLYESFKKPNEIKLWNKWIRIDRLVGSAVMNLQGLQFEVLMHYSNLRGFILIWETIQEAEALSNLILHEIKDQEERIKISSQASKLGNFLFTKTEIDKEGYLDLNINFEKGTKSPNLWFVMNNVKQKAINSAVMFLSWRQAILDTMEEEDFNIKTYIDMVNSMTNKIHEPIIGWNKYQTDEKEFTAAPYNRVNKLKDKYALTPNTRELEVDPEIYNYFKNEFLKDE